MKTFNTTYIVLSFLLISLSACEDFIQIDPPRTSLVKETVFEDDATANAAMLDIYYQLQSSYFASGGSFSISFLTTLLSDEQINYVNSGLASSDAEYQQFNDNKLQPNNSLVQLLWADLYKCIYKVNAVLEGLKNSGSVSENTKKQLIGEAKFIRAFCYFYLINLWGDVPMILTTDWRTNSSAERTGEDIVCGQMINDLLDAKSLLPSQYTHSMNERVRVNAEAARALLARVYLFTGEWEQAETQASVVIASPVYALTSNMTGLFSANNTEAIWQLWREETYYPNELFTFYVFAEPRYGAIRDAFAESFETGDERRVNWLGNVTDANGELYHFSSKYNSFAAGAERSTIFRLAEQYLIRAEARINQNDAPGALEDLNIIRSRANLPPLTDNSPTSIQSAIEQERKAELFTEWGHRWFDLKRWEKAESVLHDIKPEWTESALLWPIPEVEIRNNPALRNAQNPGY